MGALAGSIFDLVSGDPTQSEQSGEGSLANFENDTGEGATTAGLGFENGILSGNPQEIAQTLAPEIKAGQDQVQQTAQQNAEFGNRGGGTNSSTQAAQSNERGNIINLEGGLQQGAATAELGAGQNLLSQGSTNLMNEANLATQNRTRQVGDVNGVAQGVAQIATGVATGGLGGGDPYQSLYNAQNSESGAGSGLEPSTSSLDDLIQ